MRNTRNLRASFVVTVAAAAASALGCGANVVPASVDGGSDGNNPPTGCPATRPADGQACVASGTHCGYEACGLYSRFYADCMGGRWQVSEATCNPPPPDVPDLPPPCPPTTPMSGSACDGGPTQTMCPYGDCLGTPTTQARCVSGRWEVAVSSCNPPPDVPGDVVDASLD